MSDPVGDPLDEKSDEEVLDLLGPSWSAMTPTERRNYGPPLEDPYFAILATFASGRDVQRQIVRETYDAFDRIEARLVAIERRYTYRAAVARLAGDGRG